MAQYPRRIKQILINIIGNAVKFTDVGGVQLVTRFVADDASPKLQFDILDTGVGMTEEQTGRLFEAFAQADSTVTRKFGGTGLGLAISRRFAELLGGDITIVDTQPGCGTHFRTIVATGPMTLQITTDRRYAISFVLNCLTATIGGIVDSKLVMENEVDGDLGNTWLRNNTAGSGAYRLGSWKANESITLISNPDF